MTDTPARHIPTSAEILKRQEADAERDRAAIKAAVAANSGTVPARAAPTVIKAADLRDATVAAADQRNAVTKYLDMIAPVSTVGRIIKFTKDGKFVTTDDDALIDEAAEFVVLADQTLGGWIKFNDGGPPDRVQGLPYSGFVVPTRPELGVDMDQSQWPLGLSGLPEDPWKEQTCLVLQNTSTSEMFTFVTASKTGRRAAGNLLRHYDRMVRINPSEYPVVKLKTGGFPHKDERIGWVYVPTFVVVGRAQRDSASKPDTSMEAQLQDEIPFN